MRLSAQRAYARHVLWRTVLLLAALALGYWVTVLLNINLDATRDRRYSLSQTSLEILSQITQPIELYYLVDSGQLGQNGIAQVHQFLQMLAQSHNTITYQTFGPEEQPLLVSKFSDGNTRIESGSLLIEMDNKRRVLAAHQILNYQIGNTGRPILLAHNVEQLVIESLVQLLGDKTFNLFFANNHGEIAINNFISNQGIPLLSRLEQRNYHVMTGNLQTAELESVDSLIFIAPTSDLSEQELILVNQWLDDGHHLYINLIFQQEPLPRFEALLNRLGISSQQAVVMESNANLRIASDRDQLSFLAQLVSHPITTSLQNLNLQPILRAPRQLSLHSNLKPQITQQIILQSSNQAQLLVPNTQESMNILPNTSAQIFPLAIAVTINNIQLSTSSRNYVISGDLSYLSNHYANEALMLEALNWLHAQEQNLLIPPKSLYLASMRNISQRQAILLAIILVIIIPALLLAGALSIHWHRKRG